MVRIDHNSQEIREINGKLDQVIESVVESNSLSVDADEKAQRVAELEAGKRMLEAPQAERGLLERLFVPVLKWIAEKSAEQVIATLVITLLTLIAAYFGFSL